MAPLFRRPRKCPSAIDDRFARFVHSNGVVPTLHDRQAILSCSRTASKPNREGPIAVWFGGQIIEAVRVELILLKIALFIVEAYGPKARKFSIIHGRSAKSSGQTHFIVLCT